MDACREKAPLALGWLALTLFAGLRPQEADAIPWKRVDFSARRIWIDAAFSKVRRMRIVEPQPVAFTLLAEAILLGASLPIPHSTRRKLARTLRSAMGWITWPKDITRHSCASYWLALEPDAGRIALQLGNSPGILLRHYRSVVTRECAAEFFRR